MADAPSGVQHVRDHAPPGRCGARPFRAECHRPEYWAPSGRWAWPPVRAVNPKDRRHRYGGSKVQGFNPGPCVAWTTAAADAIGSSASLETGVTDESVAAVMPSGWLEEFRAQRVLLSCQPRR